MSLIGDHGRSHMQPAARATAGTPVTNPEPALYRDIVETMPEMVCRFRPDGCVTFVNRAYLEAFGLRREDLVGKKWTPVVHPDDIEMVNRRVAAISRDNPMVVIENRVLCGTGEQRWVQWTNRAILDERGDIEEIQATGRDITAQVEVETALRRSRERLRFLADATTVITASLQFETVLERIARLSVPFLADACTAVLVDSGRKPARVAAAHVDPDVEALLRESVPQVPESGVLAEISRTIAAGKPVCVAEMNDDVLARMKLDRDSAELAQAMDLRSLMVLPLEGRNRTFGVLAYMTSRKHSDRRYSEEDLTLGVEIARRVALALENARLYRELQEGDRRKDEFLATLAHELRNPIAGIMNAVSVLSLADVDAGVRSRAVEIANRQLRHQSRLIEDLLDVSRITRGKIELRKRPLDAVGIVQQVIEEQRGLAKERDRRLLAELPRQPLPVLVDPARLRQAVSNLIDNAIKYTLPGGHIVVGVEREDGWVRIRVVDDGMGIEPELLSHMFEPFARAAKGKGATAPGLGIGLAIVRSLIELHGGEVTATSEGAGKGSVFLIRLPIQVETESIVDVTRPSGARSGPSRRILIVDDNADAADSLAMLLRSWGHEVRAVYDGPSAIECAAEFKPTVAFIDLAMPGMDGFATAEHMRNDLEDRRVCIVALTARTHPDDVRRALSHGFDRYLGKPADPDDVQRVLDCR